MRDRLADRFIEISEDLRVRVVVLRGTGERHFCTGAALGGTQRPTPPEAGGRAGAGAGRRRPAHPHRVAAAHRVDPRLRAAGHRAVNGTAAGGGMHLALACDLVVMADTAKFIEVFVRRGIMPDAGGAYLLPRLVGLHRAKELLFLGDDCPAAEADRIGLVNRVVPAAELDATVDEIAAKFLTLPTRGHLAHQAAHQPQLRVEPRAELQRRGRLPGAGQRDRRHGRGPGGLPRPPTARVPGLVAPAPPARLTEAVTQNRDDRRAARRGHGEPRCRVPPGRLGPAPGAAELAGAAPVPRAACGPRGSSRRRSPPARWSTGSRSSSSCPARCRSSRCPTWADDEPILASVGTLLRKYHTAAAGVPFDAQAPWSAELADPQGGPLLCHNDVCHENVVFREGNAAGDHRLRLRRARPSRVGPGHDRLVLGADARPRGAGARARPVPPAPPPG